MTVVGIKVVVTHTAKNDLYIIEIYSKILNMFFF